MNKPKRIQRSRAKGWKMPANAIYVGRPTVWGNPYVVGSQLMNGETLTAEIAVELYEQHLAHNFSERDIRHCLQEARRVVSNGASFDLKSTNNPLGKLRWPVEKGRRQKEELRSDKEEVYQK